MESQVDGLTRYAQAKGYQIVSVTKEFASGLNDNRKKLHFLLTRSYRVFLNDANVGKVEALRAFTVLCRDITQFFVDILLVILGLTCSLA